MRINQGIEARLEGKAAWRVEPVTLEKPSGPISGTHASEGREMLMVGKQMVQNTLQALDSFIICERPRLPL